MNGELQLLGSKFQLGKNENQFTTIASYLLIVSTYIHNLKLELIKSKEGIKLTEFQIQTENEMYQQSLKNEIEKSKSLYHGVKYIQKIASLTSDLIKLTSIQELANEIYCNFPKVLEVKSAALYLKSQKKKFFNQNGDNNNNNNDIDGNDYDYGYENNDMNIPIEYSLILPSVVAMGIKNTEFELKLTEAQMKKIVNYDHPSTSKNNNNSNYSFIENKISPFRYTKLLLYQPKTTNIFGMILLIEDTREIKKNNFENRNNINGDDEEEFLWV